MCRGNRARADVRVKNKEQSSGVIMPDIERTLSIEFVIDSIEPAVLDYARAIISRDRAAYALERANAKCRQARLEFKNQMRHRKELES